MWLTYATPHLDFNSTYLNFEVLYILQNRQLFDCQVVKRLSTNQVFLASNVRVKRNFKALLMKAIKSLGSRVEREIPSFINKNLDGNHCAEQ